MIEPSSLKRLKLTGAILLLLLSLVLLYFAALPPVIYFLVVTETLEVTSPSPVVDFICGPADELHESWEPYKHYANWWGKTMGLDF